MEIVIAGLAFLTVVYSGWLQRKLRAAQIRAYDADAMESRAAALNQTASALKELAELQRLNEQVEPLEVAGNRLKEP